MDNEWMDRVSSVFKLDRFHSDDTDGQHDERETDDFKNRRKFALYNSCRELVVYKCRREIVLFKLRPTISNIPMEILVNIAGHVIPYELEEEPDSKRLPLANFREVQRRFERAALSPIIKFLEHDEATHREFMNIPMLSTRKSFGWFEAILKNPTLRKFVQGIKMAPCLLLGRRGSIPKLQRDAEEFSERFMPRDDFNSLYYFHTLDSRFAPESRGDMIEFRVNQYRHHLTYNTGCILDYLEKFCIKSLEFESSDKTSDLFDDRERAWDFQFLVADHRKTLQTLIFNGWPHSMDFYTPFLEGINGDFKKLVFKFIGYRPVHPDTLRDILHYLPSLSELDLGFKYFDNILTRRSNDFPAPNYHAPDCSAILHRIRPPLPSQLNTWPVGKVKRLTLRHFNIANWNDFQDIDMPMLNEISLKDCYIPNTTLSNVMNDLSSSSSKPNIKSIGIYGTRFFHLGFNTRESRFRVPNEHIMSSVSAISCACWSGWFEKDMEGQTSNAHTVILEVNKNGAEHCPVHAGTSDTPAEE